MLPHPRTRLRFRRVGLAVVVVLALSSLAAPASQADTREAVAAQIADLDVRLGAAARDHAAAARDLARLEAEAQRAEAAVSGLTARRDEAKAKVKSFAIAAYKSGGDGFLGALLLGGGRDTSEWVTRSAYVGKLARQAKANSRQAAAAGADASVAAKRAGSLRDAAKLRAASLDRMQRDLSGQVERQQKLLATLPPPTAPPAASVPADGHAASPGVSAAVVAAAHAAAAPGTGAQAAPAPAPAPPRPAPAPAPGPKPTGKGGMFVVTCYAGPQGTATGEPVRLGVAATDPRVIPMRTTFRIDGVGTFTALDTGGAIKGNRIDIWNPSDAWCENFGRQSRYVEILG